MTHTSWSRLKQRDFPSPLDPMTWELSAAYIRGYILALQDLFMDVDGTGGGSEMARQLRNEIKFRIRRSMVEAQNTLNALERMKDEESNASGA